jgi:hypothetical protein
LFGVQGIQDDGRHDPLLSPAKPIGPEALPEHGSTQRSGTGTTDRDGLSLIPKKGTAKKEKAKNSLHYRLAAWVVTRITYAACAQRGGLQRWKGNPKLE